MKRTLCVATLCLAASAALAQQQPDKVYVRARNTPITETPAASGKTVTTVEPGDELLYGGQDKKAPKYHQVTTPDKKSGFVFFRNISKTPPKLETRAGSDGTATELDRKASASFGAAVRGMTPGAERYADKNATPAAKAQFKALEDLGKSVSAEGIASHRSSAGLQGGGK
jgi:uncharacterized protein YgiM (DUF1202 family)